MSKIPGRGRDQVLKQTQEPTRFLPGLLPTRAKDLSQGTWPNRSVYRVEEPLFNPSGGDTILLCGVGGSWNRNPQGERSEPEGTPTAKAAVSRSSARCCVRSCGAVAVVEADHPILEEAGPMCDRHGELVDELNGTIVGAFS